MRSFGEAVVLFSLNVLLLSCEASIRLPSVGTRLTFFSGTTAKIKWELGNERILKYRILKLFWYFGHNYGSRKRLARLYFGETRIYNSSLPGIAIEKPATLVLKNVDLRYNGTYLLEDIRSKDSSVVVVFIAVTPNVTINCSSPLKMSEGENLTCLCRDDRGNPPAKITWYKDGRQIGETGMVKKALTLRNVNREHLGKYVCVAQSHVNATDVKSIEVRLNFKPERAVLKFEPDKAVVGESFTISCSAAGFPEPSYTITHNETEISNLNNHTISKVSWSDAGLYQCVAENKLGRNVKNYCLFIAEPESVTSSRAESESGRTVVVWHIVVSLLSGIMIGVLFSIIVWFSHRRWLGNKKPESNRKSPNTQESIYQDLDLSKMNTEHNYQSLQVNSSKKEESKNDDSIYMNT